MSPVPTAPGVYVDIAAAAPSPSAAPSTGTWFVTGEAAQVLSASPSRSRR